VKLLTENRSACLQHNLASHQDALHGMEKIMATHLGADRFHELKQQADVVDHHDSFKGYINDATKVAKSQASDPKTQEKVLKKLGEKHTTSGAQQSALHMVADLGIKVSPELSQGATQAKEKLHMKVEGRQEGKKAKKQGDNSRLHDGKLGNGLRHAADQAVVAGKGAATKGKDTAARRSKGSKAKGSVMVNPLHAARQDDEAGNGDD
jgi:hypothetical protein